MDLFQSWVLLKVVVLVRCLVDPVVQFHSGRRIQPGFDPVLLNLEGFLCSVLTANTDPRLCWAHRQVSGGFDRQLLTNSRWGARGGATTDPHLTVPPHQPEPAEHHCQPKPIQLHDLTGHLTALTRSDIHTQTQKISRMFDCNHSGTCFSVNRKLDCSQIVDLRKNKNSVVNSRKPFVQFGSFFYWRVAESHPQHKLWVGSS